MPIQGVQKLVRSMALVPDRVVAGLPTVGSKALQPMYQAVKANAAALRQARTPAGEHLDEGLAVGLQNRYLFGTTHWLGFSTRRSINLSHLVEFGTAPHYQPKRGVMHPGAQAKPFFVNGFASTSESVVRNVGTALLAIIVSAAKSGAVLPKSLR